MEILFFGLLIIVGTGGIVFFMLRQINLKKGNINRSMNLDLLLVRVPQDVPTETDQPITRDLEREWTAVMEQLLSTLANLEEKDLFKKLFSPPITISLEVATVKG
ncbi:MAG: hypothetical protein U9O94_04340, partial [Nanoarchaeota archaeon]|nr:hypothetical protein [Nanoarchaeota archaeon]